MAEYDQTYGTRARVGTRAQEIDEGLRSFMLGIYNYMTVALAVTGLVALGTHQLAVAGYTAEGQVVLSSLGQAIYMSPLKWVLMFAPLGFILVLSFGINRMSVGTAQMTFWAYSAVMGLSISWIFLVYTSGSIAKVFFITSAVFGAMSLYGYTTKKDISNWGGFLFMGVIGVIIAGLVNLFLQSDALGFAISIIVVLVFTGLTAWDTQQLKSTYLSGGLQGDAVAKTSIMGALSLYLNFINIFMALLNLMGDRE